MSVKKLRSVTTDAQVINGQEDVIIFNSAGNINFYLGPAYGDGRKFELINIGAGTVTVLPDGTDTINAGASITLLAAESTVVLDYVADTWTVQEYNETSALTTKIGANPSPVSRTNNPIIAANTVNANVDALDAAIGASHTPLTRATGQTAVANAVNANIDALDTVIGADAQLTAVARTTGPVATTNSVYQNVDALDSAIGFEAQMSGTPHVVTFPTTVFQALDKLDTYKSVQTVKKTIGGVGVAGCDFNFATAANTTEQVINLGAIVPAKARIVDVFTFTDAVFTGATTLVAETGTSSSGNELIGSATIYAANAITAAANAGAFIATPSASATNIYVSATPGANWSNVTAGKVSVYVTFINVTNI